MERKEIVSALERGLSNLRPPDAIPMTAEAIVTAIEQLTAPTGEGLHCEKGHMLFGMPHCEVCAEEKRRRPAPGSLEGAVEEVLRRAERYDDQGGETYLTIRLAEERILRSALNRHRARRGAGYELGA